MIKSRKKYSKEFKQQAVELLENGTMSTRELAEELGVHANLLYRWREKIHGTQEEPFPGNGRLSPEQDELRRLKRENADLKMERDILKKAINIFSKTPK